MEISTQPSGVKPSQKEIDQVCQEIFEYHQACLEVIGIMARPLLTVESRFSESMKELLRLRLPLNSESELSDMTDAIVLIARKATQTYACQ